MKILLATSMKKVRFVLLLLAVSCTFFIPVSSAVNIPVLRVSPANSTSTPFWGIQAAYDDEATIAEDQIQCRSDLQGEVLSFGRPLDVSLTGGYEPGFGSNPGFTTVNGLTISAGSMVIGNIVIADAVCGNGWLDSGEQCDDGYTTDGDGCSATCQLETGYTCSGSPSTCTTVCGDSYIAGNEQCDDSNTAGNDGCSPTCTLEAGFNCTGTVMSTCTAICGDGIKVGAEACDDGNTENGDGCSFACSVEQYWSCSGSMPSSCSGICGDGIRIGAETCDDGNTANGDGCSSICTVEPGWEIEPNNTCGTAMALPAFSGSPLSTQVTGNVRPVGELDYYSFTIPAPSPMTVKLETYFGTPVTCGSTNDNDTYIQLVGTDCTTVLAFDDDSGAGWCSKIEGSTVAAARNLAPGTYYAMVKNAPTSNSVLPGYTLSVTVLSTCGNGVLEAGEACDDGNNNNGDGCSAACAFEAGFTCTGTPSACVFTCGNGSITGAEQCDDGNLVNGDGCSSLCQLESTAETEPNSTCAAANGPYSIPNTPSGLLLSGSMAPASDQDWYSFTIPVYADLWFETFDASGYGTCSPNTVDTMLQLFKSDCVTAQSAVQDQGGIGNCSRLNSVTQPATMKHLAPGTYRLKVYNYGTTNTYNYTLQAKYASYCGNGVVEGSEQCDGGGSCQADCTVAPTCGDGTISAGEQCDDGNMVNNDGCSSSCTVEPYYQCSGAVPNVCTKQEAICNDGIDNDNDGLIDAADPDCAVPAYFTACGAGESLVIYRSAGGVQTIPDNNATGITQSIVATMPGTIHRIALLYNITHTFDSDVDVYLTPPGAVSLDVSTDNGSSGDNFVNTLLDTTCSTGISAGTPPFTGCYKPETAFTALIGTSPVGVWSLKVSDDAAGDVGTLNSWSLILCTSP